MTRQIQKAEEVWLIELMRHALGGDPPGQIERQEVGEEGKPDVVVIGGRRIGIEVTELHQDPGPGQAPRRPHEEEGEHVARRARELAETSPMPVVDVSVRFNDAVPIRKDNRDTIARRLVEFVSTHLPETEDGEVTWNSPLPWTHRVRVYRNQYLTKHNWTSYPVAGWVQLNFVAELQRVLDEKNARHDRYRQHCDECWLLIHASGFRPSGLFDPSDETRSHRYRSLFARTFFMDVFSGRVIELKRLPESSGLPSD